MNILEQITEIKRYIKNNAWFSSLKLRKVVQEYNFIYLNEINQNEQDCPIGPNIQESKVIIIDYYQNKSSKSNELHFIISFKRTIIILRQELLVSFFGKCYFSSNLQRRDRLFIFGFISYLYPIALKSGNRFYL